MKKKQFKKLMAALDEIAGNLECIIANMPEPKTNLSEYGDRMWAQMARPDSWNEWKKRHKLKEPA